MILGGETLHCVSKRKSCLQPQSLFAVSLADYEGLELFQHVSMSGLLLLSVLPL